MARVVTLLDLIFPPGETVDRSLLGTATLFLLAGTETSVATIGKVMVPAMRRAGCLRTCCAWWLGWGWCRSMSGRYLVAVIVARRWAGVTTR